MASPVEGPSPPLAVLVAVTVIIVSLVPSEMMNVVLAVGMLSSYPYE